MSELLDSVKAEKNKITCKQALKDASHHLKRETKRNLKNLNQKHQQK